MKFINGLFIILFFIMNVYTQERKSIQAHRFIEPPTIDGNISENEWKQLYELSEETFVEESESLKKGAAGAGLTDND